MARSQGASGKPYPSAESAITKGRWIQFALPTEWQTLSNVTYRWEVKNTGDEAKAASQMGHVNVGGTDAWREARYKGVHSMTCEVLRGGTVIARGVRRVQVARW